MLNKNKPKVLGLTAKYDDEDEYEDYEYNEDGENEDFEVEEGEESENFDISKYKNLNNEKEDEDCQIPTGKITIEYMGKEDKEKPKTNKKKG